MLRTLLTCLFLFSSQLPNLAQSPQPNSQESGDGPLVVGVSNLPPFAIKTGNDWDGIGVHLWREVAQELDLDYEWRELQPRDVTNRLQDGTVDVAIAVTATASAEQQIDFAQSYFRSSLGIARRKQGALLAIARAVVSPQFLRVCLGLAVLLAFIGVLAWLFERQTNEEMFHGHPVRGIWAGFWWAGVTMTTVGYGDKAPTTVAGKILALLWMLMAMGITASLTAYLTSSVLSQVQQVQLQDLNNQQVGSIANSSSAQYLQQKQIQFQSFSTPLEGLQAVRDGDIDAFVYSAASLQYLNQDALQNTLQVKSTDVRTRQFAFALPENSELLEQLNHQVLQELNEPDWQDTIERYLPNSGQ